MLRPVLFFVLFAGSDKNKPLCLYNMGSLVIPKWELAYSLKSTDNAQKSPTYSDLSVDRSEKQKYSKTLICTEYNGKSDIYTAFTPKLQLSLKWCKFLSCTTRGGGTFIWGVHGGVPRIRVIFSRKNLKRVCQFWTKIPERAIISVKHSRKGQLFWWHKWQTKRRLNWSIFLT